MRVTVPLGEYLPDQAGFENPGLSKATNVMPLARGYIPWPAQSPYTTALDSRALGAFQARDKDNNVYLYCGDAGKLYSLNGTTWDDLSKAGSPAYVLADEESWEFVKWGEKIIAVSGVNTAATNNPQIITMGGTVFADLGGSPPQARNIAVVRSQVVVGNTYDVSDGLVPNRVRWSGIEDETAWTVSATTQADFQDLQGNGGWVKRIIGGEYGLIFQERSVWRMTYVGSPLVFQFDEILPGRGTPASGSVARVGDAVYFLSQEGFEVIRDGTNSEHIGAQKVDQTFFDDLDASYMHRISATFDPVARRVYWSYPGMGHINGAPNRILCYDWSIGRWSMSEQAADLLFVAATPGVTSLDALDAQIITGRTELVTNGTFASDSNWTKGTGWTIGSGVATHAAGSASEISQDVSAEEKHGYYLSFTVTNRTAGSVTADVGGTSGTARSTNATFTETIHGGAADTELAFTATSDFDGDIDDVSLKSASIDTMTESLDSRVFRGGAAVVGVFNADFKLAFWSGDSLPGVLETTEGELAPGRRARIRDLRPQADRGSATVEIGSRDSLADAIAWSGPATPNARGRITRRSNHRYHTFRLNVSGDFEHVTGIDVEYADGGWR